MRSFIYASYPAQAEGGWEAQREGSRNNTVIVTERDQERNWWK